MDSARRISAYRAAGRKRLTPRQRRRLVHKTNHSMAPFGSGAKPAPRVSGGWLDR
jgi:hypothetical protein